MDVFNFSNILASYRHIKLCCSLFHLHLSSEYPQIKFINLHHIIDKSQHLSRLQNRGKQNALNMVEKKIFIDKTLMGGGLLLSNIV